MLYIIGQKVADTRVAMPSREWFSGSQITTSQVSSQCFFFLVVVVVVVGGCSKLLKVCNNCHLTTSLWFPIIEGKGKRVSKRDQHHQQSDPSLQFWRAQLHDDGDGERLELHSLPIFTKNYTS
jgi:hypothetical protein